MVVNYAGRADAAEAVVRDVEAAGGQALAVQADVALKADVDRLFAAGDEAFGRLRRAGEQCGRDRAAGAGSRRSTGR